MSNFSKSFSIRNVFPPGEREKVGGSRMIASNFSPLRASRGNTAITSSARKRWSVVDNELSPKFSRPRASDFLERSTLTVFFFNDTATTEKEQVYAKQFSNEAGATSRTNRR